MKEGKSCKFCGHSAWSVVLSPVFGREKWSLSQGRNIGSLFAHPRDNGHHLTCPRPVRRQHEGATVRISVTQFFRFQLVKHWHSTGSARHRIATPVVEQPGQIRRLVHFILWNEIQRLQFPDEEWTSSKTAKCVSFRLRTKLLATNENTTSSVRARLLATGLVTSRWR